MGMSFVKHCLFSLAGAKMGRMAARQIKVSVDVVFPLAEVNQALQKVATGGSNGKTVLRIG